MDNQNTGTKKWLGKEGDTGNGNGVRIINICIKNDLVMGNIKFTDKYLHTYTKKKRNRGGRSIINYVLV